jgi:[ribosomal protein S5]-alanine N-acetyltransferase
MPKITLRNQKVSDAKRFYEILNNPNFKFFKICPKSVEAEKDFLRQNVSKRKKNYAYNYTILYDGKLIGGCGIKINQHRKFIGEIGYFIDEAYWRKGIATKAVKLIEKIGFSKLGLSRIEIVMDIKHAGSKKVAVKCGYLKEGIMRKAIPDDSKLKDAYLYAKVLK